MRSLLPDQVQVRLSTSLVDILADSAVAIRRRRYCRIRAQQSDSGDFRRVLGIGKLLLVAVVSASPLRKVFVTGYGVLRDKDHKGRSSVSCRASEVGRKPNVAVEADSQTSTARPEGVDAIWLLTLRRTGS